MNTIYQCKSLTGERDGNEDEIDVNIKNTIEYYGVYDGHGGSNVSHYLKEHLSKSLLSKNITIDKTKSCDKQIINIYNTIQTNIDTIGNNCGSTALVALYYKKNNSKNQLKIINLGDCRAILCNHNNIAVQLTKDHKPTTYDEYKRIIDLGGNIIVEKNDDPRINGLSVSRAFGDNYAKPYVTHIPEIYNYEINSHDKFIVLACDGVWDVLSNQDVVDFVLFKLDEYGRIETRHLVGRNNIANALGKFAISKGSGDNISVVIIFL